MLPGSRTGLWLTGRSLLVQHVVYAEDQLSLQQTVDIPHPAVHKGGHGVSVVIPARGLAELDGAGHFLSAGLVEYVERVAAQGVVSADQQVRAVDVDVPGIPQGQRFSDEFEAGAPLCGEFGLPVSVRAAAAGQEQNCH